MRVVRPRAQAAQRTEVDDPPTIAGDHAPRGLLATKERGFEVHVVDKVPIGFGDLQWIDAGKSRGVINQTVDASRVPLDFDKQALDLGNALQIGTKHGCIAAFESSGARFFFRAAVVNGDARTRLGEPQCNAAPDALSGSGDQNDAPVE